MEEFQKLLKIAVERSGSVPKLEEKTDVHRVILYNYISGKKKYVSDLTFNRLKKVYPDLFTENKWIQDFTLIQKYPIDFRRAIRKARCRHRKLVDMIRHTGIPKRTLIRLVKGTQSYVTQKNFLKLKRSYPDLFGQVNKWTYKSALERENKNDSS